MQESKEESSLPVFGSSVQQDPWHTLRAFTNARIALGRAGTAIPVKEVLSFRLAHAHARDAVYSRLDTACLHKQLSLLGLSVQLLHSDAEDRVEYLQRPDKGRRLAQSSVDQLLLLSKEQLDKDVALVITDGLSATAINQHVYPLLQQLLPMLRQAGLSLSPCSLVQQGRVAIGDETGTLFRARVVLVFIGERPGLSSADSLGLYLTYHPRAGLTDASRNCISNIRPEGLPYAPAAEKIFYLLREALQRRLSGVQLKDNQPALLHHRNDSL